MKLSSAIGVFTGVALTVLSGCNKVSDNTVDTEKVAQSYETAERSNDRMRTEYENFFNAHVPQNVIVTIPEKLIEALADPFFDISSPDAYAKNGIVASSKGVLFEMKTRDLLSGREETVQVTTKNLSSFQTQLQTWREKSAVVDIATPEDAGAVPGASYVEHSIQGYRYRIYIADALAEALQGKGRFKSFDVLDLQHLINLFDRDPGYKDSLFEVRIVRDQVVNETEGKHNSSTTVSEVTEQERRNILSAMAGIDTTATTTGTNETSGSFSSREVTYGDAVTILASVKADGSEEVLNLLGKLKSGRLVVGLRKDLNPVDPSAFRPASSAARRAEAFAAYLREPGFPGVFRNAVLEELKGRRVVAVRTYLLPAALSEALQKTNFEVDNPAHWAQALGVKLTGRENQVVTSFVLENGRFLPVKVADIRKGYSRLLLQEEVFAQANPAAKVQRSAFRPIPSAQNHRTQIPFNPAFLASGGNTLAHVHPLDLEDYRVDDEPHNYYGQTYAYIPYPTVGKSLRRGRKFVLPDGLAYAIHQKTVDLADSKSVFALTGQEGFYVYDVEFSEYQYITPDNYQLFFNDNLIWSSEHELVIWRKDLDARGEAAKNPAPENKIVGPAKPDEFASTVRTYIVDHCPRCG
jgi:hypothetical protein